MVTTLPLALGAGEEAAGLYLYGGNELAGAPPADGHAVYRFFDDFEDGTLDAWTTVGTEVWSVATGTSLSGARAALLSPVTEENTWQVATGVALADVRVEAAWRFSGVASTDVAMGARTTSAAPMSAYESNSEGASGWNVSRWLSDVWSELVPQPAGQTTPLDTWIAVTVTLVGTGMKVEVDGAQVVPASGWVDVGTDVTSGSVHLKAYNLPAGESVWIDDVRVSDAVASPPQVELLAVEALACE
jgi:hypothetical protein